MKLTKTAVDDLLGDRDTWAKWLSRARNSIGHLNTGELEKNVPEDARYRLTYVTKALLHLVLMQQLGIGSSYQRKAVNDNWGYSAREFKASVARYRS